MNPAFSGPVILGNVNQWFNPAAFLAPPNSSGFYGNLGRDTLIGPGLGTWDFSALKDTPHSREIESSVPRRVFQSAEQGEFQWTKRCGVHPHGRFSYCRLDYEHIHDSATNSIRSEAALVSPAQTVPLILADHHFG